MPSRTTLRDYFEMHLGKALPDVRRRRFVNALFADCRLKNVAGAQFINCVLQGSAIEPENIHEIVGVTATLDCFTFEALRLSPLALDALIFLLTLTSGNDETRRKLEAAIEPRRLALFRRAFPQTE